MNKTNKVIFSISTSTLVLLMMLTNAHAVTKSWELKNNFLTTKVWQHEKESKLYVSIEKSLIEDTGKYKSMLKTQSDKDRSKLLSMIDITDWTASKKSWIKVGNKNLYKIKGSYIDPESEKVFFEEYHEIGKNFILKSVFTSTKEKAFKQRNDINSFLKKLNKESVSE